MATHHVTTPMQFLTDEQVLIVRQAIASGSTRDEAAAAAGITVSRLCCRLKDQLADLRVGRGRRRGGPIPPPPTPEEIRERAAEVRRGWGAERYGAKTPWSSNDSAGYGRAASVLSIETRPTIGKQTP